jgi:23S rRNA (cytosine1962-C5)-methyltransferase
VEAVEVREQGLAFGIRPGEGLAVGLYLDMREARGWVRSHARGRTLLNCFAYTGAFAIAARAGGAARAVDVDLSRRSLTWAEENARRNGQSPPPTDRLAGDVFDWLRRLAKRGERFDALVLDPPGFARGKGGTFTASRDWPGLVAQAAPLVAPGGWLLAACNVAALQARRFEAALAEGVRRAGRTAEEVARPDASPVDFPSPPGEEPPLKVRVLRLGVVTSRR